MLDKKWKWIAKDSSEEVFLFSGRPSIMGQAWAIEVRSGTSCKTKGFHLGGDWENSLHEIIHHKDGKIEFLRAHPELKVDDPVWVKNASSSKWSARHFAKWGVDGRLYAFGHGKTSFTAGESIAHWDEYKLP